MYQEGWLVIPRMSNRPRLWAALHIDAFQPLYIAQNNIHTFSDESINSFVGAAIRLNNEAVVRFLTLQPSVIEAVTRCKGHHLASAFRTGNYALVELVLPWKQFCNHECLTSMIRSVVGDPVVRSSFYPMSVPATDFKADQNETSQKAGIETSGAFVVKGMIETYAAMRESKALHAAVSFSHSREIVALRLVEMLLRNKADVNMRIEKTPLEIVLSTPAIRHSPNIRRDANEEIRMNIVRLLLNAKADPFQDSGTPSLPTAFELGIRNGYFDFSKSIISSYELTSQIRQKGIEAALAAQQVTCLHLLLSPRRDHEPRPVFEPSFLQDLLSRATSCWLNMNTCHAIEADLTRQQACASLMERAIQISRINR